jgi:hypothetical protein
MYAKQMLLLYYKEPGKTVKQTNCLLDTVLENRKTAAWKKWTSFFL